MDNWTPFPETGYRPIGGVNSEDSETEISDVEVQSATNFLFEKKLAFTRPGLFAQPISGMSGLFVAAAKSLLVQNTYVTLMLTTTNRLFYVLNGVVAATEITGPGFTPLNYAGAPQLNSFFNPISIQGQVLFPGYAGPPIWTLGAGTYTLLSNTNNPSYMTSNFARAVAGYVASGIGVNGQQIVEYSKPGDVTVWNTSPSTDGSGASTLTEIPDAISGLDNLHNAVVVLRTTGISLGQATGNALAPFRFETWVRGQIGSPFPSTMDSENNVMYFVSLDDVYMFDLQQLVPMGYNIRTQLMNQLTSGVIYKGFISRRTQQSAVTTNPRARYYLYPVSGAAPNTPSFVYDIREGVWSVHTYNKTINWAFNYATSSISQSPAFFDNTTPPTIFYWTGTQACEQPATLKSKCWRTDSFASKDMICRRLLMSSRDLSTGAAGPFSITATVTGRLGNKVESGVDTELVGGNLDDRFVRTWFNINQALGQDFDVTLSVPAGQALATDFLQLYVEPSGEFRSGQ